MVIVKAASIKTRLIRYCILICLIGCFTFQGWSRESSNVVVPSVAMPAQGQSTNGQDGDTLFTNAIDYLQKHNDPTDFSFERLRAIRIISIYYSLAGQPKKAIPYLALLPDTLTSDSKEYSEVLGAFYSLKGINMGYRANLDSALYYYELSISQYAHADLEEEILIVRNNMSKVMMSRGDYQEAMEVLFLNLAYDSLNLEDKVICQMNVGECLLKMGQYAESRPYIFLAIDFFSQPEYYSHVALNIAYNNIGEGYLKSHAYDSGLYYLNLSKSLSEKAGYEEGNYSAQLLIANYHLSVGDWKNAFDNAQEVYDYYKRSNLDNKYANPLKIMARASQELGLVKEAYIYLNEGMRISEEILKSKSMILEYLQLLVLVQSYQGNYKEALSTEQRVASLRSELLNEEKNRQIKKLESEYQTNEIKQELAISRSEQAATEAQLASQRLQGYFLLGGLLFIGIILILVTFFYNLLNKSKVRLALQNEQLEILNKTKDRFFTIVGHDLRGPITSLTGVEKLISWYLESNDGIKLRALGANISRTANQLEILLNNLLNWATSQSGVIPYNPNRILLLSAVKDITELFNSQLEAKQISLITLVDDQVETYADFNALMLVMRNLLSNAMKFTNPGGRITIECTSDDERVEVRITDDGIGIEPNRLTELLKYASANTTEGTAKEKGTGLGLILCKEYVSLNRGELKVESEVGVGTTFTFDLPKFKTT